MSQPLGQEQQTSSKHNLNPKVHESESSIFLSVTKRYILPER